MRKASVYLFALVALGALALVVAPAAAGVVKLSGTHTRDEIKTTCEKNGGTFDGVGGNGAAYGCIGKGGTVQCNKDGTCAGVCPNCGGKSASSTKGGVGGILTGSPKTQPLRPQQVTTSPGRAPTRPLTQQHVGGSPKAQPLTTQKTTASPKTASSHSTNASSSLRRNGR
jgi:hypothetical protein